MGLESSPSDGFTTDGTWDPFHARLIAEADARARWSGM